MKHRNRIISVLLICATILNCLSMTGCSGIMDKLEAELDKRDIDAII